MGVSARQWLSQCQVVTSHLTKEKEEGCKCRVPCQELCFVSTEEEKKWQPKKKNKKEKESSNLAIFLKNITLQTEKTQNFKEVDMRLMECTLQLLLVKNQN